ncbi:hypothetical protein [Halorubrum lipolyticum]|uniref:hypothetical protein n=1 Tax=Halorubrum lipolyticum TaxID=368624 RepID=UPI000677E447|nr:hypothetical protein [Halorubrum lipolyticum]
MRLRYRLSLVARALLALGLLSTVLLVAASPPASTCRRRAFAFDRRRPRVARLRRLVASE